MQNLSTRARRESAALFVAVAVMALAGGGPATMPLPRLVADLAGVVIVVRTLASTGLRPATRLVAADWLVMAALVLALAQLVPLPPALWEALPGRGLARDVDLAVFGHAIWRPISLDPAQTTTTLVQSLPPLAVYLAIRMGGMARFLTILDAVLSCGIIALTMGLVQMIGPDVALLHPYPAGSYDQASGFFTNHNHQAEYLACMIPLAGMRFVSSGKPFRRFGGQSEFWIIPLFAIVAMLVLATGSRVGTLMMAVAIVLTLVGMKSGGSVFARRLAAITAVLGCMAVLGAGALFNVLHRVAFTQDQRWDFYPDAMHAARAFWPVGAGLGTFVDAFAVYEPAAHLSPHYLNHAHNDYIEIALEAGIVGLALVAAMVAFSLHVARQAWFGKRRAFGQSLGGTPARLVAIPPLLLFAHSFFDYPLRTFAIAIVMAACLAFQANLAARQAH